MLGWPPHEWDLVFLGNRESVNLYGRRRAICDHNAGIRGQERGDHSGLARHGAGVDVNLAMAQVCSFEGERERASRGCRVVVDDDDGFHANIGLR